MTICKGGEITGVGKYEPSGGGASQIAALRCRPDGELDPRFASRGFFHRRVGIESAGFAAVTEPDGRVLVAGRATIGVPVEFESFSPLKNSQPLLLRFR